MLGFFKKIFLTSLIIAWISCSVNSARAKFTEESNKEKISVLKQKYQTLSSQKGLESWAKLVSAEINELEGNKEKAKELYKSIPQDQAANLDAEVGIIRIAYLENKNSGKILAKKNTILGEKLQKAERYDLIKELNEYKEKYPSLTEPTEELSPESKLKKDIKKAWNKNESNLCLNLIKKFKTNYPSNLSTDILYIEAKCNEDLGQLAVAHSIFRRIINSPNTELESKTKSYKDLYLQQLKQGNLEETKKILEEAIVFCSREIKKLKSKIQDNSSSLDQDLKNLRNLSFDHLHFLFWLSQILDQLKADQTSITEIENKIIKLSPLSYYRFLLNNKFEIEENKNNSCLPEIPNSLSNKLKTLKQFKMEQLADNEISWFFSKKATSFPPLTPININLLKQVSSKSYLHFQYGLGNKGVALSDNALRLIPILYPNEKIAKDCFDNLFYSSFPTPFLENFREASDKYNVPVSFLLAIARTESFFNPLAHSPKDALGLMQLLKATAQEEGLTSNDDLYDYQTNIKFGAKHLSTLLHYYDNNFILAAAAYNGGRDATNRWISKTKIKDFSNLSEKAYFVEQISFPETRNYVQRVFLAKEIYDLIQEKELSRLKKQ